MARPGEIYKLDEIKAAEEAVGWGTGNTARPIGRKNSSQIALGSGQFAPLLMTTGNVRTDTWSLKVWDQPQTEALCFLVRCLGICVCVSKS